MGHEPGFLEAVTLRDCQYCQSSKGLALRASTQRQLALENFNPKAISL